MTVDDNPAEAAFEPTHLIHLDELDQAEKETYYDLLIAADAHFHRDYETGDVLADMRILGPGVRIEAEAPPKDDTGPRLTPQEKLAIQAAQTASLNLPGAITTATGEVFNYKKYENIVKLIRGKSETGYKPKRRPLAWVMRLIHEIYDIRYTRDTSDIGGDEDFESYEDEAAVAAKKEKEELQRQTNVFPIFIVDLFSKKYGLKSLVESTTWDLLYSMDQLRTVDPDVEVFCRFVEMFYDADELLYYCYVRSLTQSVLNANFKGHWADPGRVRDSGNMGVDRKPPTLVLNRRECNYIAQTIFIRTTQGEEVEHERQMYADFMANIDNTISGGEVDSSEFLRIAVERYFATRPDDQGENAPPPAPVQAAPAAPPAAPAAAEEDGGPLEFDHPLMIAVFSGQSVETSEAEYIASLMESEDFMGLPDEVRAEVQEDLSQELNTRLMEAETAAQNASNEREFQLTIANAIQGFDAMAKLVAEHVQTLKGSNSFNTAE